MKLPRFGVEEWLNSHEKSATYDLAGVSISSMDLAELFQLTGTKAQDFFEQLATKPLNYGWIEGSPDFKDEVARLYQNINSDQVLQTNGATGANMLVLYAMIEPGDHLISLYPTYQQLYDIPKSLGAEVDLWHIREEHNWLPDLEDLRQMIRPNTKMICINNANNPTGAVMDETYLRELVAIAEECGAYILSDEVYHSFSDEKIPAIVDLYDRGISVNSLSKTYSLPGIRVGWVVSNDQVASILRDYRDYTMICAGVFDDMVATLALKHKEKILERNEAILKKNLAILQDWVASESKAELIAPKYVSTSFVKLRVSQPIEDFCLGLLKQYGVLLVPGSRFDIEGNVRLGFCCDETVLREGLQRISEYLSTC